MHRSKTHAPQSRRTFEKGTRSSGAHQSVPEAKYGGWNASPLVSPSQITARTRATIGELKSAGAKAGNVQFLADPTFHCRGQSGPFRVDLAGCAETGRNRRN